jgi:hypothetical protein
MTDPHSAADRLLPDELPRLALFLGALVPELSDRGRLSAQQAAWRYAAEAESDELEELAEEWSVLVAAGRELPIAELGRLLRERFGSEWQPATASELDAVAAELARAILD